MKQFFSVAGQGLGGSFLAYLGDRMLFQKLGVSESGTDTTGGVLFRNAARFGVGGLAAWLFPGPFGAAVMGALGYPIMGSLEAWWRGNAASANPDTTEADLNAELHDIEAELSDILEAS